MNQEQQQPHLWEIKHPYYCNEGNYFNSERNHQTIFEFKDFCKFLAEWGNSDEDMNLVFRWDWEEDEDDPFTGDIYYRNGTLKIFFMIQRKGYHITCNVSVCRADEIPVINYLRPKLDHMRKLWEPLEAVPIATEINTDE